MRCELFSFSSTLEIYFITLQYFPKRSLLLRVAKEIMKSLFVKFSDANEIIWLLTFMP